MERKALRGSERGAVPKLDDAAVRQHETENGNLEKQGWHPSHFRVICSELEGNAFVDDQATTHSDESCRTGVLTERSRRTRYVQQYALK